MEVYKQETEKVKVYFSVGRPPIYCSTHASTVIHLPTTNPKLVFSRVR